MEVEVVFPRVCGAFYQAFIQDVNLKNGTALLSFPSDWKPSVWVELSHMRFPQDVVVPVSLGIGSKVEALLPHHDNEPPGWWTGTLLKSRGELHVVEFQSGSEKYQDIVDHDKLRSPNTNLPLSKLQMYRKEIAVSEELDDYCQRRGIHENFRNKIKAMCVSYDRDKGCLIVLASTESCLERADLLSEMHLRDLRTQKSLLSKNEIAAQRFYQQQSHRNIDSGVKEIRFHVPLELVGMAIGREGANVNEARRMTGVVSVEFDDYSSMFSVKGENDEALSKARERLEFTREMMLIPRNLAGKVIGKKGNVIQEILEKSRVHNVKVVGEEEAKEREIDFQTQVPFDFIGRKSEVDNAKMMMEYHLEHLKSVEKILQSRRDIDSMPNSEENYFPAPSAARGYRRGFGRSGRGSYRGGNRSGRQRESQEYRNQEEETPPPNELNNPVSSNPDQPEELYQSDSDSESNEERGVSEERSAPEDDEQGPDRRRQQYSRGRGSSRRSGGGGGGGRGRGGRGGRGYRNQRRQGGGGGGSRPHGNESGGQSHGDGDANNFSSETRLSSGGGGNPDASPKPQRQNRGRQRGHTDRGGTGDKSNGPPLQPEASVSTVNGSSEPPKSTDVTA